MVKRYLVLFGLFGLLTAVLLAASGATASETGARRTSVAQDMPGPGGPQTEALVETPLSGVPSAPDLAVTTTDTATPSDQPDAAGKVTILSDLTTAPPTIRVLMTDGQIVEMPTDEYLQGVVPFEIGPNAPLEAQKAQAVAARTYAATRCLPDSAGDPAICEPGVDANVDTTTRTQVWRPSPRYETSNRAIAATSGVVLRQNGRLIPSALYFAHTFYATRNNEDAFNGAPVSYLRSVASPDPFNRRYGHGVGMSQIGATVLADWGARYDAILRHYYTGVSVDLAPGATPASTPARTPTATATATVAAPLLNVAPARDAVVQGQGQPNSVGLFGTWSITGETWAKGSPSGATVSQGQFQVGQGTSPATYTSPILAADFEFQALSVHWQPAVPPGSQVTVEARVSQDGKTWGAWSAVPAPDGGPDDVSDRSTDLHFELGRFAQVRLSVMAASPLTLNALTVHYYDGRGGPDPAAVAKSASAALSPQGSVPQPPIVSRSAWGAPETFVPFSECDTYDHIGSYIRPNAFAVHHTGPPSPGDVTDLDWLRLVYNYHVNGQGWGDIGYNYVVGRDGTVYQGRARGSPPAGYLAYAYHAASDASHRYYCQSGAVMALGIYQPGETPLTEATLDGLSRVLAWLNDQYGIRPWSTQTVLERRPYGVCGHRDLNSTECPGDVLYGRLDDVRNRVQTILDSQPNTSPTPTSPPPPATATPRPPQPRPPTPQVTPTLGAQCFNTVRQGDFSASDQWQLSGSGAYVTQSSAFSQPLGLFLGRTQAQADTPGWASARQSDIAIPANVQRARLAFWYAPYADGNDDDRIIVQLQDANGAQQLPGGRLLDVQPPQNYRGWVYFEADVTDVVRGQSQVTLYFGVYNDGNGLKTFARVDDVTLEVCGGPTPTPTATATATPTRTPTATPTPVPITCNEWARNGQFTVSGNLLPGWTVQASDSAVTASADIPPGTDGVALQLGRLTPGADLSFAAVWQDFAWPRGVISATLTFSYKAQGGDTGDTRVVELRDVTVGGRFPLFKVEGAQAGAWQTATLPIAARPEDHTAEVYFAVMDQGGANAQFLVDNVSLRLCGRGLGGPYPVFLPRISQGQ